MISVPGEPRMLWWLTVLAALASRGLVAADVPIGGMPVVYGSEALAMVLTAMVTRGVMKRQDTRRRRWLARVGA